MLKMENNIKIPWWRILFGEEELKKIRDSLLKEHVSMGSVTEEFENAVAKSLDVPYAIATTSGSVSLLMSIMALGIGKDDEVIIPNRTWIATANAPLLLGAKVILVDVKPDAPLLDTSQIREKITKKTKAIIPVHLNGASADMEDMQKIAEEHDLNIIEDACQALFSKNKRGYLGTQSDAGCFSLAITKLISTAQGGIVVTKDKEIYEKLKLIRWHGAGDNINPVYRLVGCNFKFNDILASIGLVQLSKAKNKINNANKIYETYAKAVEKLPYIKMVPVRVRDGEVAQYVEVLCKERTKLADFLKSEGIETRPSLPNLNSAPYLKSTDKFPNSDVFCEHGLYLPCGPDQPLENIERVIQALKSF